MNRSSSRWGASGIDRIEGFLVELNSDLSMMVENGTWTPGCDYAVRQLLCRITLPFCKNQSELREKSGGEVGKERGRGR